MKNKENLDWINHPESRLRFEKAFEEIPTDIPIEVGAEIEISLELFENKPSREWDNVVSHAGLSAVVTGALSDGKLMAQPKHQEWVKQIANMDLVEQFGLVFQLHSKFIRDIEGSNDWNLKHKKVYCTEKVAAGEKVGFFLDYTLLNDPLVYKKVLFSVTEMEKPKKYKGENRVIIPLSQLVKHDKCSYGFLYYPCPYGAVKYSETQFKFFLEEDIKYLDPKIYMAIPELDFREGAHEEIFNNKNEENDDESECSFPF